MDFQGRIFGAHTSISGGVAKAVERAVACQFTGAQIFVKSNHQWSAAPLAEAEVKNFRTAREKSGIFFFGHTGYLINLAGNDDALVAKSLQSLVLETERAAQLGLPFLVLHPGSHGGDGEEVGLARIIERLRQWQKATAKLPVKIALECTAGQGAHLGYRLEHLRELLERLAEPARFGVCLDTAHLFAAGYELGTAETYENFVQEFGRVIGAEHLLAFHLNDSKVPLGSRKDRHEHLGRGYLGLEAFRLIVQDKKWRTVPMILETPKSEDMHEDRENLAKLAEFLSEKSF